jgi:tryptophan synthase alpha subunit
MSTRIDHSFAALAGAGGCGLVTFLMAGDPDPETDLAH